jgi:molecular chaperone HtpG
MSTRMQRILQATHEHAPTPRQILEINPSAPLIRRLSRLSANSDHDPFIRQCALQLWSNTLLLEGMLLEPQEMVSRVQAFIEEAAEKRSPIVIG